MSTNLRHFVAGAWYGDAFPDGSSMAFTPFVGFQVDLLMGAVAKEKIANPPGQPWGLSFPRFHPSPLQIAGQPHELGTVVTPWFHDGAWDSKPVVAFGVNSVIFKAGVLQVNTGQVSAQGFRYVNAAGRVVTGDETIARSTPLGLIHEFTQLANGWLIGQGHEADCVLWDGSVFRVVHSGSARFIRVVEDPATQTVAIALTTPSGVQFYWHTYTTLAGLPQQLFFDPPKDPIDPPKKDPVLENKLKVVEDVRKKYPTPLGARHPAFLIDLAKTLGAKLFRKDGGAHVTLPSGDNVSMDIIILANTSPLDVWWVDVLGDAEGAGTPTWDAHPNAGGEFVDVSSMVVPGQIDPPPPIDVKDAKIAELQRKLAELQGALGAAHAALAAANTRIADQAEEIRALRAQPTADPSASLKLDAALSDIAFIKAQLLKGFDGNVRGPFGTSTSLVLFPRK